MESIVLILMFVCGQPDTIIVKFPGSDKTIVTHEVHHPKIQKAVSDILKHDPVIISYEDDRGVCA